MLAFFALFGIGWWVVTIAFAIYVTVALEKDHIFWPILCLVLYILFIQYISKTDIVKYMIQHPWEQVFYFVLYLVFGFLWSFIKWWLHVYKIAEKHKKEKEIFKANWDKDRSRYSTADAEWAKEAALNNIDKPLISKHKGKVTLWVMYWPISFIWSLLDDLIKKIIRQIITHIQKLYQMISDRAFKNL